MVERQLCKLEVRGSNPLASKIKFWRQHKSKGPLWIRGSVIPLPPKPARRGGNFYKRAHFRITSGSVIPLLFTPLKPASESRIVISGNDRCRVVA